MIFKCLRYVTSVLFTIALIGCGSKQTMVVLIPDNDGKTGTVTVSNDSGSVDISAPNQATTVAGKQSAPSTPALLTKDKIDSVFSEALEAQPKPPVHFILYFIRDSNQLTQESFDKLTGVISTIKDRNSISVYVVGHTDTVGTSYYNFTLSKKRAEGVRDLLITRGVNKDYINATSHGEENPIVKTGDDVHEPKNRRVEVVVR